MCLFQLWSYIIRWRLGQKRGDSRGSWWGRNCREAEEEIVEKPRPLCSLLPTTVILPTINVTRWCFWAWWPWPLTYDLYLRTWPRYLQPWLTCKNSSLNVRSFGQDSETDGHTDGQTMPKLLHPPLMRGVINCKQWFYPVYRIHVYWYGMDIGVVIPCYAITETARLITVIRVILFSCQFSDVSFGQQNVSDWLLIPN